MPEPATENSLQTHTSFAGRICTLIGESIAVKQRVLNQQVYAVMELVEEILTNNGALAD